MVIKGTVHNGRIQIENAILPEGTQVLITPVQSAEAGGEQGQGLDSLKDAIRRIAALGCESTSDHGFSNSDHDKVLYGN